ncbi:EamA family transporter RarD [Corynebacterium uterequi]|uniref:RarD protein n=1 Tax=Corynebacterium uterequi TaxID=1072256 RepID=A0A0G3HDQ1_9CORY|nr:EamA family transporter RarD [Corynebacterium uterequi]AKK11439.1 rarD protein [Corynebacterium uterequi]
MLYVVGAYLMWGFFPAYFPLLLPASPLEILAHRVLWSAVLMVAVLTASRGWGELARADRRTWARLAAAGVLVTANWGIYVLAVNSSQVASAALGYFINPLVSVLLGLVILRESLTRGQVTSVAVAGVGVAWLTFQAGEPPLVALGLAFTFGFYGLIKKRVSLSATASLTAETLVMTPVALAYLLWLGPENTFATEGNSHTVLLMLAGVITALPLFCFGKGAKELPLSTIGMLQYMTPVMQLLWALLVTRETLSAPEWVGYVVILVAVAIFLTDLIRRRRRVPRPARARL